MVSLPVCEPQLVTELTHIIKVGETVEKLGISYALQFDFEYWKRSNVLTHYLLGRACRNYGVPTDFFGPLDSSPEIALYNLACEGADLHSGIYHASIRKLSSAIHYLERHRRRNIISSNRSLEGHAYRILGICYAGVGEFNRAIGYLEGHLQRAKDLKDFSEEGNAYLNLGICYAIGGERKKAIDYLKRLLLIAKTLEDRQQEEDAHEVLGICYASVCDYKKAIDHLESHLLIVNEIGEKAGHELKKGKKRIRILASAVPVSWIMKRPCSTLIVTFKSRKNHHTSQKKQLRTCVLASAIPVSGTVKRP